MFPVSAAKYSLTIPGRQASAALKELWLAANGPRGSEPLTARGVAELCGVELKTVHNWAAEGRIAHFRTPGRHLRFQAADVLRFLETCGYAVPPGGHVSQALVVADGALLTRLRRGLKGLSAEFVSEPLTALVVAGQLQPDAIVVASAILKRLPVAEYLAVLDTAFPRARILCLGELKIRKAGLAYKVLADGKLRTLRAELGLS